MFKTQLYLLRPFILFSLLLISTLLISRVCLGLWQIERFNDVTSFLTLLFNGLRIDLSTLGYVVLLPALIHPWLIRTSFKIKWLNILKYSFGFIFISVIFFELATPAFINEYGFRPNRLFIEYLPYPNEVFNMLVNGHLFTLVTVLILLLVSCKAFLILFNTFISNHCRVKTISLSAASISFLLLFITLFISARGSFGHRPINPALVYFSTDPLINSLTLNSTYSVAHAFAQLGDERNASKLYGKMEDKKVIQLIQQATRLDAQSFTSIEQPSFSQRQASYQGKPKNLVIILEESLGAQFVSSLGGLTLTPEIDKLNQQGWMFKNLYATGTRSVRGIEAVITGFTPTPARAVVKLDKSQQGFFTIASLLKDNNYATQFIYGGESHFDNMKSFFLGNGFTDIVDFNDIEDPKFVASWGASDEDLFNQADTELTKLHKGDKPFFSFIFTSSNHDPFEIPDNVVTPISYSNKQYDQKEQLRHKAIQYADFALGRFITKAKTQDYWQNTVFLIVADHDARAQGSDLVPIKNFHIPGVILNSGKAPFIDNRIVSQIDLAPTLLSLIGINNNSPMLGHDLNNKNASGRAMMQYADNFAYMTGEEVTILQPNKAPLNFVYDQDLKTLSPTSINRHLSDTALAHVLWGSLAYQNEWYSSDNLTNTNYVVTP